MSLNNVTNDRKRLDYLLVMSSMELQECYDRTEKYDVHLSIDDGQPDNSAKESLERYFAPQGNKRYERRQLRKIQQEREEKFEDFVQRIQRQAKRCQFIVPDDHAIDQIIAGCSDSALRKRFLAKDYDLLQVLAMEKLSMYLYGIRFEFKTDWKAPEHLFNKAT